MSVILVRPEAGRDLDDIWDYIAPHDSDAATRVLNSLYQTMETLVRNPLMGRSRKELAPYLRSFPVERYIIFYSP